MIYILCKIRRYIGRESRSLFIPQNGGYAVKGLCVKQMRLLLYSSAFERIKKVLINKSRRLSPSACSIFFRELPWRQRGSLLHCHPQYNSLTSWQTSIKTFEIAIERERKLRSQIVASSGLEDATGDEEKTSGVYQKSIQQSKIACRLLESRSRMWNQDAFCFYSFCQWK